MKLASHARLDSTTRASKRENRLPPVTSLALRALELFLPISKMQTITSKKRWLGLRLHSGKGSTLLLQPATIGFHDYAAEFDLKVLFGVLSARVVEL